MPKGFNFKAIFSASGADKLKAAFAGALEPAMIFAETGSKASALWGGLKAVILNNVLGPVALLSGAVLGVISAMKMLVGNTEMLRKGMQKLKEIEFTEAQFQGLLGGVDEAKERVEDLYKFANETPFQMGEVAEASRMLQVLTKGALASGEALKMVGDAAATAGADISNVALHVGRMYNGLESGRPVGEAAARLQELGIVSGAARNKLEQMTKAGNSFSEIWGVMEQELMKNEGGMKTLSKTLKGLETTLADAQDKMQAGFAKGFMDAEKESVERMTDMANALAGPLEKLGEIFGMIRSAGNKIAGLFLAITGGAKKLSAAMSFVIDAFMVFGAAVGAAQLAHLVMGLTTVGKAFLTAGKGAIFFTTWQTVQTKGTWAAILSLRGLAVGQKAAGASAILAGTGYRIAAFFVKGFTAALTAAFGAIMRNPITALIAGLAALGVMLYQTMNSMKAQAKAAQEVSNATRDMTDAIKDQMGATDTAAKKATLMRSIYKQIGEAAAKAGEARGNIEEELVVNKGVQESRASDTRVENLLYMLQQAAQIDETRLRVSEARMEIIQKEYELTKAMAKQAWDNQMAVAGASEKYGLMMERQKELLALNKETARTREHMVNDSETMARLEGEEMVKKSEEKATLDSRISAAETIQKRETEGKSWYYDTDEMDEQAEDYLTMTTAGRKWMAEAKASGKYSHTMATRGGGTYQHFNKQQAVEGFIKSDAGLEYQRGGIDKLKDKRLQLEKDSTERMSKSMIKTTGSASVDKDGNIEIKQTEKQKEVYGEIGAIMTTIRATAAGTMKLNADQLKHLNARATALKSEAEGYEASVKEVEDLENAMKAAQEQQHYMATQRQIDVAELREMKKITEESLDADKEKLDIQIAANKDRIAAFKESDHAGGGKSHERAKERIKEMNEAQLKGQKEIEDIKAKGANATPEEKEQLALLEAQDSELLSQLIKQEAIVKNYEDAQAATKGWLDALVKLVAKQDELDRKAAKMYKRLKEDIAQVARDNEVDFRMDTGDIAGALDMLDAFGKERDRIFLERRTEELQKTIGKDAAAEQAARELGEKNRGRGEAVVGKMALARREGEIVELELAGRMGNPAAKQRARQMRERDFLKDAFRKNLGDATDPVSRKAAMKAAGHELMAKKMNEVPEVKTIADGFRKIGAGGGASSTDPAMIAARKRLEALKAIADMEKEMKTIHLETQKIINERLNFNVQP
jgi:hypothetical protein